MAEKKHSKQNCSRLEINWWMEKSRHLLIAAVIASCTLLVEMTGSLAWLDATSLRLASSFNSGALQQSSPKQESIADIPIALLIDDKTYEDYFDQSSPLNRGKLVSLIKPILEQNPALLAVDIDLAPGASDRKGNSHEQLALDGLLDDSARNGCQKSNGDNSGCKIVLAMPFHVASEELKVLQLKWIKDRCSAGIQFAKIELLSHQGTVLRHSSTAPSLGNVSGWWVAGKHGQHESGHEHGAHHNNHEKICQEATKSSDPNLFFALMERDPELSVDSNTTPLNTEYFAHSADSIFPVKFDEGSGFEIQPVKGRVVFLGGSYGKDDKFVTADNVRDGTSIHAAAAYSYVNPVHNTSHLLGWGLDIVVGLLLGLFFFEPLWKKYNEANKALKTAPSKFWAKFATYLRAKFWLILNFLVLFIIVMLFLFLASKFLSSGYWLNPGPMIIGMFIDTLLSSRSEEESESEEEEHDKTRVLSSLHDHFDSTSRWTYLFNHFDRIWQFVVVGVAIWLLLSAHH